MLPLQNTKTDVTTEGIGNKAVTSAAWLASAKVFSKGLGLVRLLILAAILPLDQLGLFGIAVIAMQFLSKLSETGMTQALIQKKGDVANYLGTAWVAQLSRGLILGIVILTFASTIEVFFEKLGVARLLMVMSVIPLIQGLQNVGMVYLHRELRFNKIILIDLIASPVELITSISIVWFYRDAMALVIARIVGSVVIVALGFLVEKRWPTLNFSLEKFQELYGFGFWIFANSIISFSIVRGSDIIIGKYLTEDKLAIYQIAYGLACIPLMEVMAVIGKPTFSAFSRIQNDQSRFCKAFLRVFAVACYVAAFSIAGFYCLSLDFVTTFMKKELLPVAAMLPWLAVWAACRALGSANSMVLQAAGKPSYATIFQIFMLVLFLVVLWPMAIQFETFGVIYSLVGIGIAAQIVRYSVLGYVLRIPLHKVAIAISISLLMAIVASTFTVASMNIFSSNPSPLRLGIGLLTLVATYSSMAIAFDRWLDFGLCDFAIQRFPVLQRLSISKTTKLS